MRYKPSISVVIIGELSSGKYTSFSKLISKHGGRILLLNQMTNEYKVRVTINFPNVDIEKLCSMVDAVSQLSNFCRVHITSYIRAPSESDIDELINEFTRISSSNPVRIKLNNERRVAICLNNYAVALKHRKGRSIAEIGVLREGCDPLTIYNHLMNLDLIGYYSVPCNSNEVRAITTTLLGALKFILTTRSK